MRMRIKKRTKFKTEMSSSKKFIILVILILNVCLAAFTVQAQASQKQAIYNLIDLGYTEAEADAMVSISNARVVVKTQTDSLDKKYQAQVKVLTNEIGVTMDDIVIDEDLKTVQIISYLEDHARKLSAEYNNRIKQSQEILSELELKVEIDTEQSLVDIHDMLQIELKSAIDKLKDDIFELGGTTLEIEALVEDDMIKTVANLESEITRLIELKDVQGYEFDRAQAMSMFEQVNAYRASMGLKPYSYNYEQQACVDSEAVAYSSNNNPHNWACATAANENAGISSINSNYVKIAMDFFISDPPHHAVLVGNHQSAAVSIVLRNGKAYMILDVFNF